MDINSAFAEQVNLRLPQLVEQAQSGTIARAAELMADAVENGGVIRAFGTGHSEAFAMEVAGRAGGLIPTSKMALRDVVLYGSRELASLADPQFERDESVAEELFALHHEDPNDIYVIASNSGVNGSIVGVALRARANGHRVIAVTSMQHTAGVQPKHSSGSKLHEIADVVIDNLAPYGDVTLDLGDGIVMGAVSSITAAFIGQLLTLGVAQRLQQRGITPPVYISANVPEGDAHNDALKARYAGRLRLDG